MQFISSPSAFSEEPLSRTPFVHKIACPNSGKTVIQQSFMPGIFPRGHTQNRGYKPWRKTDPRMWSTCNGVESGTGITEGAPQLQPGPRNREPPSWLEERQLAGGTAGDRPAELLIMRGVFSGGGVGGTSLLRPHPSPPFLNDHKSDNDGHYDGCH